MRRTTTRATGASPTRSRPASRPARRTRPSGPSAASSSEGHVDVLQPDLARCGGFTVARQIADLARERRVEVVPHCFSTGVLVAASLHFAATLDAADVLRVLGRRLTARRRPARRTRSSSTTVGSPCPTGPGLGIDARRGASSSGCGWTERWRRSSSTASTKRFPDGTVAVDDVGLDVPDGEFMILVGPSGLREDDGAAHGRRPRGDHRGGDRDRRPGRERARAEGAGRGDGLPELRALPAHDRAGQHRLPAQDAEGWRSPRSTPRVAEAARLLGLERAAAPQAARALGRPAPAGRDGPGDRPAPAGVPDGRAAVEPRREAARPDAGRARQPAPPTRRDDAVRDARPDRGDDARPRGSRCCREASSSRSTRLSACTTVRRTRSSRASSARRR